MTDQQEKAIKELRATLGKMEVALGHTGDAVVWTDASGAVQWCNAVFDRLVGLPHIKVLGRDLTRLLPLEENGRILSGNAHPIQIILASTSEFRGYYYFTPEGDTRFLEVVGRYFEFDPTGGSVILTIRDITNTREFEQIKLKNLALNAAANAIVITDRNGRVMWANHAFTRLTGYALDEVYGQSLKILNSGHTDSKVFKEMWQAILSGRVWSGTLTNRKRNGDHFSEEQTITPVLGEDGHISHFIAIKQDVTERERINHELAMSESRMRSVLETAADGIITTDEKGIIQSVNPAAERLFGYSGRELIGSNVKILMPEPYHSRHDQYIRDYFKKEQAQVIAFGREVMGRHKDGTLFPIELSLSEINEGRYRLFTGILRDITSRKLAEKEIINARREAEKANQSKSVFLSNMSHEIRTPLGAVVGMADLLMESELTAEQKKLVQILISAGRTLLSIINDILDFSKIEAGQICLDNQNFHLLEELGQVCKPFLFSAGLKGLTFDYQVKSEVPVHLFGDPVRLRQILTNLIGNAFKFTENGSISLEITLLPADENEDRDTQMDRPAVGLLFSLKDTGIGISHDQLDHIFDRFSQADDSITGKIGGPGLGLAISRQLVEMMGGRIWVESEVNQGSTFHFSAVFRKSRPSEAVHPKTGSDFGDDSQPAALATEEQNQLLSEIPEEWETGFIKPVPGKDPGDLHDGKPIKILLVEDNEANRIIINAYVKNSVISMDMAENGAAAVEKIKKHSYDLVLMDVRMPIMDGYTATREIREWEAEDNRTPTPIIALTAHALDEDVQKSIRAGCNAHLIKPIKKDHLLNAVWKYARNRKEPGREDEIPSRDVTPAVEKKTVIQLDAFLEELIPEFLEKKSEDIVELRAALEIDDFGVISHIGHNLKGVGTSYGFENITRIGGKIESAAREEDHVIIGRLIEELSNYLEQVEIVFK